ncbi:uncharacterized protein RP688-like [Lineus longissimus]|uniref:uncharacterized protein RP688-like n=1 Tax=Lineus longissimus TaxID=88925 RepID=UPI00315CE468
MKFCYRCSKRHLVLRYLIAGLSITTVILLYILNVLFPWVWVGIVNLLDLYGGYWTPDDLLRNSISEKDRAQLVSLLKVLLPVLDEGNFTYLVYGGTLLGSWRHHAMMAWDDDIDIMIDYDRRGAVIQALKVLEPDFVIYDTGCVVKFHRKDTKIVKGKKWGWPFVDVTFFGHNSTHLWDMNSFWISIKYKLTDVFPLHKRPFESLMVNSPHNTLSVLYKVFGKTDTCSSWIYSHKVETAANLVTYVKCETLKDVYPFVHRKFVNGKMRETLMKGDKVLHVVNVDELEENLSSPYSLERLRSTLDYNNSTVGP